MLFEVLYKRNKKQFLRPHFRSFNTQDEHFPTTDDIQDINYWRCGSKGHASFMCHFPPPPRGSSIVQPSEFRESNSLSYLLVAQLIMVIIHKKRGTTNLNCYDSRRNSNSNCNSTPGRYATTNPSNSVNCVKTQTNKRALI
ncbi:hypothetical protein TNCT_583311 [Trichonephila clavata]|uniref:Uncharacterized protein n=1 Tax=Trichonephila clavata TaxID=2740835 RepID=A0A8X6GSV6_TRICU|nr:hypothetical protein TNCT_583311 [Trichonephila clavata]